MRHVAHDLTALLHRLSVKVGLTYSILSKTPRARRCGQKQSFDRIEGDVFSSAVVYFCANRRHTSKHVYDLLAAKYATYDSASYD